MFKPARIFNPAMVACIGVVVTGTAIGAADQSAQTTPTDARFEQNLSETANAYLGLYESEVISLDINAQPGEALSVAVPIEGVNHVIDLYPHSTQSADYQVITQVEDGSYVEAEPSPVRTMRGSVADVPGSTVAASLLEDGLYARINLGGGQIFWIESIGQRVPGAEQNQYAIFHASDVIPSGGICGTVGRAVDEADLGQVESNNTGGGIAGSEICVAELGIDADFEYFQDYGSVSNVEDRINTIINFMNTQYEEDVDLTHLITTIIVRTTPNDPYSSTNPSGLLNQFQNHWFFNQGDVQRDVAQLFTGKDLNGGVIGIAATIGSICSNSTSYCLVQSDCCNPNFICATDLSAHELGHLWNANHCNCNGFTMNPFITCANQFNSNLTIPEIVNYADTRPCLDCGGINEQAPLSDFDVVIGDQVGGNLSSLLTSNNSYLSVESVTQGPRNNALIEVTADSPFSSISELNVTVEYGAADESPVFSSIQIFDFDANQYVGQNFFILSMDGDTTIELLDVSNPDRYVASNGDILIRITQTAREPQSPDGFTARIDQVEVTVSQ